jgi:hypothetical protein
MKLRIFSLTTLLFAVSLIAPAMAQIPNNSLNSVQRHHPDFFEQGREQFEREVQMQIQLQPHTSDSILAILELPPMPPDFNPFVAEHPSTPPTQTAGTNQEQEPATMPLNN